MNFLAGERNMKRKISKKDLAKVKELDLLTYFQNYDPDELIRCGKTDYKSRSHGSLHMSNGMWCWWAHSIGGKTALDYFVKVEGWDFLDAALHLLNLIENKVPVYTHQKFPVLPLSFQLPAKNDSSDIIMDYLCKKRCLDKEIVKSLIQCNLIYEAAANHAAVFVGYDQQGNPKHASIRSTDGDIKKDVPGSNKGYSFSICNLNSKTLRVFEAAIDLLSYMTLLKRGGKDYSECNYLSISGATLIGKSISESTLPVALETFLNEHDINKIYLHFDNDRAGKETALKIQFHLEGKYEIIEEPPNSGKDFNELCMIRNGNLKLSQEKKSKQLAKHLHSTTAR